MHRQLLDLIKKHRDVVIYIFFGVLTTLVNYAVFFPLYNLTPISAVVCNSIAWLVSVLFAFLTNKTFVFNSHNWSSGVVIPEFAKFAGCRVFSGAMESAIISITVELLCFNGNVWKIISGILVIVLNYVGSKLFVFKNNKK